LKKGKSFLRRAEKAAQKAWEKPQNLHDYLFRYLTIVLAKPPRYNEINESFPF